MERDLEYERKLYEIEESPQLNGYILFNLLDELEECSIEQLAVSFYLYRFANVLTEILNRSTLEQERDIIKRLPEQDRFNLDTILLPFLTEKYNERFKKGIVQLISRSLIIVNDSKVTLNRHKFDSSKKEIAKDDFTHQLKVYVISKVIREYEISDLNKIISKIVGERNG